MTAAAAPAADLPGGIPAGLSGAKGPAAPLPQGREDASSLSRSGRKSWPALLSDPAHISDYELLYATSEELTSVKERLVVANAEWEELAETVAALEEERSSVSGTS